MATDKATPGEPTTSRGPNVPSMSLKTSFTSATSVPLAKLESDRIALKVINTWGTRRCRWTRWPEPRPLP